MKKSTFSLSLSLSFLLVASFALLGADATPRLIATVVEFKGTEKSETQKIPDLGSDTVGAVSIPATANQSPITITLTGVKTEKSPIEAFYQIYEPIGTKLVEKKNPLKIEFDKKNKEYRIIIDPKSLSAGRRFLVQYQIPEKFQKEYPHQSGSFVILVQNEVAKDPVSPK